MTLEEQLEALNISLAKAGHDPFEPPTALSIRVIEETLKSEDPLSLLLNTMINVTASFATLGEDSIAGGLLMVVKYANMIQQQREASLN